MDKLRARFNTYLTTCVKRMSWKPILSYSNYVVTSTGGYLALFPESLLRFWNTLHPSFLSPSSQMDRPIISTLSEGIGGNVSRHCSPIGGLTLDLPFLRPYAGAAIAIVGGLIAWFSSSHLLTFYDNFLLLISFWIAPWLGITFIGALLNKVNTTAALDAPSVQPRSLIAFVVGILVIIPFMDTTMFEGPIARLLGHGDISYYLGLLTACLLHLRTAQHLASCPYKMFNPRKMSTLPSEQGRRGDIWSTHALSSSIRSQKPCISGCGICF